MNNIIHKFIQLFKLLVYNPNPKNIITLQLLLSFNCFVIYPHVHLGITPIYGSFVKSPCDSQPLQFHGHNFTVVRTSNQSSFVDRSTKLHTLAVTRRLFGPAGEKRFKTANPGSYTEGFRSSENFALQQNFHIQQFHGHSENAKKIDFMQFSK